MKKNNHPTLPLLGHLDYNSPDVKPDPTVFGLKSLLYHDCDIVLSPLADSHGNVVEFRQVVDAQPETLSFIESDLTLSVGQPQHYGLVADPAKPAEIAVLSWLEMARFILNNYSEIRPHLTNNPVAAFRLCGFMTGTVPHYLRANGLEDRLDLAAYPFEMDEMKHILAKLRPNDQQFQRFSDKPPVGPTGFGPN
ncbi:MAG TPA: hypothetical protein VMB21_04755 [Candidatus Limnocylindria bacterium]|jgi:hypothetical protein|nr:hypothetical protein [Candidatus Limnocylindria bacterium]HTL67235.1 hypothetical protein [Lacunisphaera sp.]